LGSFYDDLRSGFYFDKLWDKFGSQVVAPFSQFISFCDEVIISGALTKGSAALISLAGLVAKSSYRNIITYALYWTTLGAILFLLIVNR